MNMPVLSTTYLYDALSSARALIERLAALRQPGHAVAAALVFASLPISLSVVRFGLNVLRRKLAARRGLYITSDGGKSRIPIPGLPDAGFVARYLLGDTRELLAAPNLVAYQEQQIAKLGMIHGLRDLGGAPGVVVGDPRALYYLCTTRGYGTTKSPELTSQFAFVAGRMGMLAAEHDLHRVHRRIVNPVFNMKTLKQLVPTMESSFDELEAILDKAAEGQVAVEFQDLATSLVLNVIGRTALATEFNALRPGAPSALTEAYAILTQVFQFNAWNFTRDAFPILNWLPVRRNRDLLAARKLVFGRVESILRDMAAAQAAGRDLNNGGPASLVATLMEAAQGEDGKLSPRELRDELLTFLVAGHETSANLLGMIGYFLAKHPEIQAKLAADLDQNGTESEYLMDVINESIRLHSPAYSTMRMAAEDLQVPLTSGGTMHMPKGARLFYPIQAIHTNPAIWGPDAEVFRPERWSDEVHVATTPTDTLPEGKTRLIPPYGFMPFLGGSRACIGRAFAILEIKLFVARLFTRYSVRLADPKFVPTIEYTVTAKAAEVPLVFSRR
ncbi:hypothetical protein H9P43_006596 [Blastocladiella emersonii ATCC 22665]|nr:hypothetical protein H9P43_006596 [Blastocladiella emersonii ATCC 22665]